MMGEKKALKARYLKLVVAAAIIMFMVWLMSVLKCGMSTPVY